MIEIADVWVEPRFKDLKEDMRAKDVDDEFGGGVIKILDEHNVQLIGDNGSVGLYCMVPGCQEEMDGVLVDHFDAPSLRVRPNGILLRDENNNYMLLDYLNPPKGRSGECVFNFRSERSDDRSMVVLASTNQYMNLMGRIGNTPKELAEMFVTGPENFTTEDVDEKFVPVMYTLESTFVDGPDDEPMRIMTFTLEQRDQ